MRLQTFFVAHTGIHIPTLHEMCRETLNPHIGTGTGCFGIESFYDVYFTSVLYWRTVR